jgi:hypothetical protein
MGGQPFYDGGTLVERPDLPGCMKIEFFYPLEPEVELGDPDYYG